MGLAQDRIITVVDNLNTLRDAIVTRLSDAKLNQLVNHSVWFEVINKIDDINRMLGREYNETRSPIPGGNISTSSLVIPPKIDSASIIAGTFT